MAFREIFLAGRDGLSRTDKMLHLARSGRQLDMDRDGDLSVASGSIICQSRRLRQITDLRDTDKSRCFAITEFNNCFIIRSPSLFSHLNHYLTTQRSDLPLFTEEHGHNYT